MFGTFQQTTLRVEIEATTAVIRDSLLQPRQFKQWLWPQTFSEGLPDILEVGTTFISYLGPIKIHHEVTALSPQSMRIVVWEGVDGFHEWCWGDGWVQSRLEGISGLPLNLAQSLNLWRLQRFLQQQREPETASG
ncbi:MAG: hypothetical protein F6J95_016025 [Leptolyngbya sp. SIO1E4]|nr:hypothetical protein [Leptolyngbya sp. SIO1E4]